jgi:hypothetical protein
MLKPRAWPNSYHCDVPATERVCYQSYRPHWYGSDRWWTVRSGELVEIAEGEAVQLVLALVDC